MADNIWAGIGQARADDYRRYRQEEKKDRRRARRDQLLYGAVLAPIGQAVGQGVSDFLTEPFEKKYEDFLGREGRRVIDTHRQITKNAKMHQDYIDDMTTAGRRHSGVTGLQHAINLRNSENANFFVENYGEDYLSTHADLWEKTSKTIEAGVTKDWNEMHAYIDGVKNRRSEEEITKYFKENNPFPKSLPAKMWRSITGIFDKDRLSQEEQNKQYLKEAAPFIYRILNEESKEGSSFREEIERMHTEALELGPQTTKQSSEFVQSLMNDEQQEEFERIKAQKISDRDIRKSMHLWDQGKIGEAFDDLNLTQDHITAINLNTRGMNPAQKYTYINNMFKEDSAANTDYQTFTNNKIIEAYKRNDILEVQNLSNTEPLSEYQNKAIRWGIRNNYINQSNILSLLKPGGIDTTDSAGRALYENVNSLYIEERAGKNLITMDAASFVTAADQLKLNNYELLNTYKSTLQANISETLMATARDDRGNRYEMDDDGMDAFLRDHGTTIFEEVNKRLSTSISVLINSSKNLSNSIIGETPDFYDSIPARQELLDSAIEWYTTVQFDPETGKIGKLTEETPEDFRKWMAGQESKSPSNGINVTQETGEEKPKEEDSPLDVGSIQSVEKAFDVWDLTVETNSFREQSGDEQFEDFIKIRNDLKEEHGIDLAFYGGRAPERNPFQISGQDSVTITTEKDSLLVERETVPQYRVNVSKNLLASDVEVWEREGAPEFTLEVLPDTQAGKNIKNYFRYEALRTRTILDKLDEMGYSRKDRKFTKKGRDEGGFFSRNITTDWGEPRELHDTLDDILDNIDIPGIGDTPEVLNFLLRIDSKYNKNINL